MLEALASEMRSQVDRPVRGWRASARRTGKVSMLIMVSGRALDYRLRQGQLRSGLWA